jgi:hypothetical protein
MDVSAINEQLQKGECPCCGRVCGYNALRQSVMAHIRGSKEPAHIAWRQQHWHKLKRGNRRKLSAPTLCCEEPKTMRDSVLQTVCIT